jgi:hypothetical protein
MANEQQKRTTPEEAILPYLITIDEDSLSDEEHTMLVFDRKLAEKRGKAAVGPGSGMGEFITEVKEAADGRVQVFTELRVVRETVRRFTLRPKEDGWALERCDEPCPVCHGSGKCHVCGEGGEPGVCHCCKGKGFHWRRLFILPRKNECSFCNGTGACTSCDDGSCRSCSGRGWIKSPSFNPAR